ncbi:hypothetical protein PIB30_030977 [Stylosanthes scabra]|uniref:Uncharacterized protein n=1 Tax=Stylosanthes scabra TaxID=79078 RepID=A0ABU6TCH3_9FABA|nr:hypothetical protein [Stylosanthes scabra]
MAQSFGDGFYFLEVSIEKSKRPKSEVSPPLTGQSVNTSTSRLSESAGLFEYASGEEGFCSAPSSESKSKPLYWKVDNPTLSPIHLQDLPGFTRGVYKSDHALITPESQVYSPLPDWYS